ncbi:MAG: flagellar biosynthesis protein FlhB [Gammaproteobacteria bacterium]|nr:flagellar biosynthesis protein FlhB [Gammaproteobacteria bacterium]
MNGSGQDRAVALEYGSNPVPLIVATGREILAREIVAEANRQGVPVMHDSLLAARLADLPIGAAIPEDVYRAVAVVLSWVYWMEGREPKEG